jgi:integrator complex subunit 12
MMEEPVLSDHSSSSSSKKSKSSNSSKHSNKSSKNSSPVNLPAHDTPSDILQTDDTLALEILEDDLTCVICKGMDVSARNRLMECQECHSLYHQECHIPHILDSQIDVPKQVWYCSNCSKSQVCVFIHIYANLYENIIFILYIEVIQKEFIFINLVSLLSSTQHTLSISFSFSI